MSRRNKPKTIAFVYNVRHKYPDPKDPRTQLEVDFDDPKTTEWQIKHFRNCGYKVIPIEADETAYSIFTKHKKDIDLVFNVAEGIYGEGREAQIPAMLEMLQIPYTGSGPLTQALVLDKAKTKEILLANRVPTAPFQVFSSSKQKLKKSLHFPLLVKPVAEGSGAGISNKSVVHNEKELKRQIEYIAKTFHGERSLVEPFLSGPEYSVAMIGNPPRILPVIGPDHSMLPKGVIPLDSFEVKWIFEEQGNGSYLRCPAPMDKKTYRKLEKICYGLWDALAIRDWCRIDLRADKRGNIYVLEVNSPPGIMPPEMSMTSYFPLAARTAGIDYEMMLNEIINTALSRYNSTKKQKTFYFSP